MSSFPHDARVAAEVYAIREQLVITDQLGAGYDGTVFATNRPSAVKILKYRSLYEKERDVYCRLREHGVESLVGFAVPNLIGFDDALMLVEMQIVAPACVVDFASAYLDEKPPYDEEMLQEWMTEKAELFESDWPKVRLLYFAFQRFGIWLADLKPANIMCGTPPPA